MRIKRQYDEGDAAIGGETTVPLEELASMPTTFGLDTADGPLDNDYLKQLAFNEELVTVQIDFEDNPNAENPVMAKCQGIRQFVPRGQPVNIRRKYLESLLRAKPVNWMTREGVNATGARSTQMVSRTGLRYPIQVVNDPNQNGFAWFRKILAEA